MSNKNFLDANENAVEKSLKFIKNEVEDDLNELLGVKSETPKSPLAAAPPRDFKVVLPKAGFCLKSFKINSNEKYFINVCQTEAIPPPEDITEEELANILDSETPNAFRIPMSISEPRITKDKSGKPVDVCDIAINPMFFRKIESSFSFKNFFIALIAEALSDKYNVQLSIEKALILSNRKFIGSLVNHRIRNTDVNTVLKSYGNSNFSDGGTKALIQEIDNEEAKRLKNQKSTKEPEYKLRVRVKDDQPKEVQAEFYLPQCIGNKDFTLDVGEDRILLESTKHDYCFDKFVNYDMNPDGTRAIFDKTSKMLQVRIPIAITKA